MLILNKNGSLYFNKDFDLIFSLSLLARSTALTPRRRIAGFPTPIPSQSRPTSVSTPRPVHPPAFLSEPKLSSGRSSGAFYRKRLVRTDVTTVEKLPHKKYVRRQDRDIERSYLFLVMQTPSKSLRHFQGWCEGCLKLKISCQTPFKGL